MSKPRLIETSSTQAAAQLSRRIQRKLYRSYRFGVLRELVSAGRDSSRGRSLRQQISFWDRLYNGKTSAGTVIKILAIGLLLFYASFAAAIAFLTGNASDQTLAERIPVVLARLAFIQTSVLVATIGWIFVSMVFLRDERSTLRPRSETVRNYVDNLTGIAKACALLALPTIFVCGVVGDSPVLGTISLLARAALVIVATWSLSIWALRFVGIRRDAIAFPIIFALIFLAIFVMIVVGKLGTTIDLDVALMWIGPIGWLYTPNTVAAPAMMWNVLGSAVLIAISAGCLAHRRSIRWRRTVLERLGQIWLTGDESVDATASDSVGICESSDQCAQVMRQLLHTPERVSVAGHFRSQGLAVLNVAGFVCGLAVLGMAIVLAFVYRYTADPQVYRLLISLPILTVAIPTGFAYLAWTSEYWRRFRERPIAARSLVVDIQRLGLSQLRWQVMLGILFLPALVYADGNVASTTLFHLTIFLLSCVAIRTLCVSIVIAGPMLEPPHTLRQLILGRLLFLPVAYLPIICLAAFAASNDAHWFRNQVILHGVALASQLVALRIRQENGSKQIRLSAE